MLIISIGTYAQKVPVDPDTGKITYKKVVEVEGTQQKLFNRCIMWINTEYKDPTRVTSIRDNVSGKIKGKHQFRIYYSDDDGIKRDGGLVMYDFVIELKDNRYRYTLTDFVLKKASRYPAETWLDTSAADYSPQMEKNLEQIDEFAKGWIERLNEGMQPPKPVKDDSDW